MNRIQTLMQSERKDLLNIYITAGYPKLDSLLEIVPALEQAGADLVEIGMPYSDPLADGPTIQESGSQALANGMELDILFAQIAELRKQVNLPIILMGYFNQVMQYGETQFFERCQEVGVDGLILPDLPLDVYESTYRKQLESLGLSISFLITPQTSEDRIQRVDALSSGFVYAVSSASVTGKKGAFSSDQLHYFSRIQAMDLQNEVLIGFGIYNEETFNTVCEYARGGIIGSAFIRAMTKASSLEQATHRFVTSIKPAVSNIIG